MLSILKRFAVIIPALHIVHAYCVYNRLTNSTSRPSFLNVVKSGKGVLFTGRFRATIVGYDSRACFPYTDITCNRFGSLVEPIILEVEPSFDGTLTDTARLAKCDAGGALIMYGSTNENLYGECVSRNGTVARVNLI
ncbi:uncharacterized protein EV154DRAFT_483787 [Mucor mucedo]|uniref:uncharacterized protein n=1 Tax=Mucor mucedo TaxID=29922 RepID=UPI00221FE69E|nr:uncharacterized protein EV154DRAFT_483787 [Mucor mucedo]KAI7888722.1 hypothetical protein EV154DRAFT_483787 [Mucor mucedo]